MHRLVPLLVAVGTLTLAGCNRHEQAPTPITGSDTKPTVTTPQDGTAVTPGTTAQPAAPTAATGEGAAPTAPATTDSTGGSGTGTTAAGSSGTAASAGGAAGAGGDLAMGKTVYSQTCVACHGAGIAGAPKFGDKAAWAPRIAKGKATLYDHAIHGFQGSSGAMPPRGGSTDSDAQIKAAVDYMVSQAK